MILLRLVPVLVRLENTFLRAEMYSTFQSSQLERVVYVDTDSASSCQGSAVIHVCSSDWCVVGCVGEAILPVGHCLLYLRTNPSDEAQPLVRVIALYWRDNVHFIQRHTDRSLIGTDALTWSVRYKTTRTNFQFQYCQKHMDTLTIHSYLILEQPVLSWKGCPQDFGTLLQGFASIQPLEHSVFRKWCWM